MKNPFSKTKKEEISEKKKEVLLEPEESKDSGKKKIEAQSKAMKSLTMGSWYMTFMYMGIPIIGWIYMLIVSFASKSVIKRRFARAYLLYRLTILVACVCVILIGIHIAIPYAEWLLNYIEML